MDRTRRPSGTEGAARQGPNDDGAWDAEAYHRLGTPQHRWGQKVLDRLASRLRGDETVLDAGCGTGRVTAELLERLPRARVIALDRSADMLDVARHMLAPRFGDRVSYLRADLAALDLEGVADAIFSTATLHWILDPADLFLRLHRALRPGGALVAQCGGGENVARIRRRAEVLFRAPDLAPLFDGWPEPWHFADAESTAERLAAAGFVDVETSVTAAPTVLGGSGEYAEFVGSVVFGRHLARVADAAARQRFVDALTQASSQDDPPWSLDYWRLDLAGRKPS